MLDLLEYTQRAGNGILSALKGAIYEIYNNTNFGVGCGLRGVVHPQKENFKKTMGKI